MTPEPDYLPQTRTPWNEGKTLAAWVMVWILIAGGAVIALGFVLANMVVIVVGAVIIVASLVVGKVLAILGHGKDGPGTAKRDRKSLSQGPAH